MTGLSLGTTKLHGQEAVKFNVDMKDMVHQVFETRKTDILVQGEFLQLCCLPLMTSFE
jgi:hypothetical protein